MSWLAIFVANAAVLILEIVGTRALTPFFGSSAEVWAGIIGIVLLGLAVGYWGGGTIADKAKTELERLRALAATLAASGIAITVVWLGSDATAALASQLIPYAGLTLSAAAAALILFFVPNVCLAAASPIAARLLIHSLDTSARTVGKISAIGAAGSVLGSIGIGRLLVPYAAASSIILGTGVMLLFVAFVIGTQARATALITLCIAVTGVGAIGTGLFAPRISDMLVGTLVADVPSTYGRIFVIDTPHDARTTLRVVRTDPLGTQCAGYLQDGVHLPDLPLAYTRALDILLAYVPTAERLAVVGGCNYSYPVHIAGRLPNAEVDVVELDPAMTRVATEWFGVRPTSSLRSIHADGRQHFEAGAHEYDVIVLDAFGSILATPFQLLTEEAFAAMRTDLSADGVLVMNLIGSIDGPGAEYVASVYETVHTVFPHVHLYTLGTRPSTDIQNIIVVAGATPFSVTEPRVPVPPHPEVLVRVDVRELSAQTTHFTDDYAPVERLTAPMRSVVFAQSP